MAISETPGGGNPAGWRLAGDARPARWAVIVVVAGLLFSALALLVVHRITQPLDVAVLLAIHQITSPLLTQVALALSLVGGPWWLAFYLAILIALLWRAPYRGSIAFPVLSLGGGALWSDGFKQLFQRARPDVFSPFSHEVTYSFPSGHAALSLCFFGSLIVLVWLYLRRTGLKVALTALLATLILAIGLSRLYLGVHYPSDVLGGYVAGIAWISACGAIVFRFVPEPPPTGPVREKGPPDGGP